jgi:diacylglycerol kinase (ATP)
VYQLKGQKPFAGPNQFCNHRLSLTNFPSLDDSCHVSSHPSPFKSKGGLSRLSAALGYSWKGLKAAVRYEAAFRQELAVAAILLPFAFLLGRSAIEVLALFGSIVLVLVVELLNSAVEAVADAVSLEDHPLLGRAKDLGSAAVFLAVAFALAVWLTFIFLRFIPTT